MANDNKGLTPMMRQFFEMKSKHPEALLLFRCGDFYETYCEDAVEASRILGMGDMLSLIEKAENELDEKKAKELEEKLRKNKFDLNDLLDQFRQIKKMGSIKDMLAMIPGLGKKINDVDIDEKQFDKIEAIILSMTPQERAKPDIINPSRKRRIAAGCGMQVEDVNKLLSQYRQMQKMFKQLNGGKGSKKRRRRMPPMNFNNMGNFGL